MSINWAASKNMNLILLNETFARQACELNREAAKEEAPRGCREEEVEGGLGE